MSKWWTDVHLWYHRGLWSPGLGTVLLPQTWGLITVLRAVGVCCVQNTGLRRPGAVLCIGPAAIVMLGIACLTSVLVKVDNHTARLVSCSYCPLLQ